MRTHASPLVLLVLAACANGGPDAEFLNNYTLIFDVLYPSASDQTLRAVLESDLAFVASSEGAEIFVGDNAKEANKWLTREQRKPYDYSFIA